MSTATQTEAISLQVSQRYPHSREKVFRAWTDPVALKSWFAPAPGFQCTRTEIDLRVGGEYLIEMMSPKGRHGAKGVYREIDPPSKLVFTWSSECWDQGAETLVTIELFAVGNETELVLTHERFLSEEARDSHRQGWTGVLESLGRIGL